MFYSKSSTVGGGYDKSSVLTKMPVCKDSSYYNMDHEYRGVAVIINHDVFEGVARTLPNRDGSWKDVEELKTMFINLDFKVVVWDNLYQEELIRRLNKRM